LPKANFSPLPPPSFPFPSLPFLVGPIADVMSHIGSVFSFLLLFFPADPLFFFFFPLKRQVSSLRRQRTPSSRPGSPLSPSFFLFFFSAPSLSLFSFLRHAPQRTRRQQLGNRGCSRTPPPPSFFFFEPFPPFWQRPDRRSDARTAQREIRNLASVLAPPSFFFFLLQDFLFRRLIYGARTRPEQKQPCNGLPSPFPPLFPFLSPGISLPSPPVSPRDHGGKMAAKREPKGSFSILILLFPSSFLFF